MNKISVTAQKYLNNWDDHWKNYLLLNVDLKKAGINCRQTSKNHYIKHGIIENRQVEKNIIIDSFIPMETLSKSSVIPESAVPNNKKFNFIIQKSIFKETI